MFLIRINFEIIEPENNQGYLQEMSIIKSKALGMKLWTPKFLEKYSSTYYKPRNLIEPINILKQEQKQKAKTTVKKRNSRSYSANFNIKVQKIDFKMLIKRIDSGKFVFADENDAKNEEEMKHEFIRPKMKQFEQHSHQSIEEFSQSQSHQYNLSNYNQTVEEYTINDQQFEVSSNNAIIFNKDDNIQIKNKKNFTSNIVRQNLLTKMHLNFQIYQEDIFMRRQSAEVRFQSYHQVNAIEEAQLKDISEKSLSSSKEECICCICYDEEADAIFMDCGHGGICNDCGIDLWKNSFECYLCRNPIKQILQIDTAFKNGNFRKVINTTIIFKN